MDFLVSCNYCMGLLVDYEQIVVVMNRCANEIVDYEQIVVNRINVVL